MKQSKMLTSAILMPLLGMLTGPVLADQFIVNSTNDPASGNPAACTVGSDSCSLRDALAAADLDDAMDSVVFDVDGPIYLNKPLIAENPVSIDGGGDTLVRVHQGYSIVTLPDRPTLCGGCSELVSVLQPTYFGSADSQRFMLELYGVGSQLSNIILDGSITLTPGEQQVDRIDFDSDDSTDYFLFTIESDGEELWLIEGGVMASMGDYVNVGPVTINDNELRNFGSNAIQVNFSQGAVISNNLIYGGAAGQSYTSADGISMYVAVVAEVSGNQVSQYRTGFGSSATFGLVLSENEFARNETGMALYDADFRFGVNVVVEDNIIANNLEAGIVAGNVWDAEISRNIVQHNGSHPEFQGGIKLFESERNSINSNNVSYNSGYGIVIETAHENVITDNTTRKNGGGGIILLNDAQENVVENNKSNLNRVGILSASLGGAAPPSNNIIGQNKLHNNAEFDALDTDSVCNNFWVNNTYNTELAFSGSCID